LLTITQGGIHQGYVAVSFQIVHCFFLSGPILMAFWARGVGILTKTKAPKKPKFLCFFTLTSILVVIYCALHGRF